MYFLVRGRIGYEDCGKIFKTISKGSYFGEAEIIEKCNRKYTLKAVMKSDLLTLER